MMESSHTPVLLEETMAHLDVSRKGTYIDCTLGLGGHATEILSRNPGARLIGLDIDEAALMEARKKLLPFAERVMLFHSDFRLLPELDVDFSDVRGVLLDLGISSFQLDDPERGFSFSHDGPLDMRMDLRNKTTAAKILENYSEHRLAEIFRAYGELRQAKILAREIVSRRKQKKWERTTELRLLTERVCRWRPQKGRIHPAAKVFQALRIEVNQELKDLSSLMESLLRRMEKGARIVVISFHSLEDRIIKHAFNALASPGEEPPLLRVLTKKPVTPGEEEVTRNSRARSAKLRAAQRI